jgi:two-component system KDP operon response regulator KdpE
MSLQQGSVVVVDDELSLRKVLRISLAGSGFAIEEARNGEEALGTVRGHPFDLVLLDINMPGISGIDACRKIRGMSPHAGIVMVSVRDCEDDKVRAFETGADDYVTELFNIRALTARLRALLRRARQEKYEPEVLETGNVKIDFPEAPMLARSRRGSPFAKGVRPPGIHDEAPGCRSDTCQALADHLGRECGGELEYLRTYVSMLRKKIEDDPAKPKYTLTKPWVGYRFHNPFNPDSRSVATDEGTVPF